MLALFTHPDDAEFLSGGTLAHLAERAGALSSFRLAEGFRQHVGQAFRQTDLLGRLLGDLVRVVEP
jgi:LmbE family N-acetylglucosaminyl deacetylase